MNLIFLELFPSWESTKKSRKTQRQENIHNTLIYTEFIFKFCYMIHRLYFFHASFFFQLHTVYILLQASLVAQLVKNPPPMWETWVQSLGWEDPLEKGKATHSSILAWRIPWTVYFMGSQRVGHKWATLTSLYPFAHIACYEIFFLNNLIAILCHYMKFFIWCNHLGYFPMFSIANSIVISIPAYMSLHTKNFIVKSDANHESFIVKSDANHGSNSKESVCNAGYLGLILGQEDPLEKGMATYSSILAWRIHKKCNPHILTMFK